MLKRNGKPTNIVLPGSQRRLTRGETDAYDEAFEAIKDEFDALKRVKAGVKDMAEDPVVFTIPQDGVAGEIIEMPNTPTDCWEIQSTLLKLRNSQIFLCGRSIRGQKEFAVIERFRTDSSYAQSYGDADVLLAGDDPVVLVQDYAAKAHQTLRFIASNLVAKAHKIVWERFANSSPSRVIQAISEQCAEAASLDNHNGQNQNRPQFVVSNRA